MKEASLVKFFFAKYFFLALGLLQWIISGLFIAQHSQQPKTQFAALLLFTLGLIFISFFLVIADKIKRVSISKNKIVVFGRHEQTYDWPQVKSIKPVPYFHAYKLKVRGRKKIYFFADEITQPIYGIFPSQFKKGKK